MRILGLAKILGAVAIVSGRSRTLKEWANAGYTFELLGAIASHLIVGHGAFAAVPAIMMALVLTSYVQWARVVVRKSLKKFSMPQPNPPLGSEAPERTGVLKRDVAVAGRTTQATAAAVWSGCPGHATRSPNQQVRDGFARDRSSQNQNPPLQKSFAIPALPWHSKPRLRYSPGLAPTTRLNALLNAASDS
jgi:hypothetical protein